MFPVFKQLLSLAVPASRGSSSEKFGGAEANVASMILRKGHSFPIRLRLSLAADGALTAPRGRR